MENYSKLIDAVLKKLDWDIIMKYYELNAKIEEDTNHKRGKKVRLSQKTQFTVKKELKDLIKFAIDSNFDELQHDNWIVIWSNKNGFRLEVIFTPTRVTISETEEIEEDLNSDEVERDVLNDMLKKAIKEENYELAAVIHSRLKKIDKIISRNSNPNKKIL